MKSFSFCGMLLLGLMVAMSGCDAAKKKAEDAKKAADDKVAEAKDKVGDLANIDFGDFDIKGMQEKFAGITDGFKDVSADNVDGLTSKISDLTGALDGMGIGNLEGISKTAVAGIITKFVDAIKGAMGGISDEGIMAKLKPVVDPLMEKLNSFK